MKKGVVTLKKILKKAVSLALCFIMIMLSLAPSAAAYNFPEGVDEVKATGTAYKTDEVLKNAVASMGDKSLRDMAFEMLITDETLSMLLTSVYKAVESEGEALGRLSIDYSPSAVAKHLINYPAVALSLSAYTSWSQVNLENVSWGVTDKDGFAIACSAMFGPFNGLLYTLLCAGKYPMGLVTIQGDNGYQNAIVGLLSAMGCTEIMSSDEFIKQGTENMYSMVRNIVLSVFSFLESVCASPLVRLSEVMPNFAFYLKSGGFTNAVQTLINPLQVKLLNMFSVLDGSELLSFIENPEAGMSSLTENPTEMINSLLSSEGITVAEINLELISSCGTNENGYIKADIASASAVIFSWIIDTLKLNKEALGQLIPQTGGMIDITSLLSSVLSVETSKLYSSIASLMTQTAAVNYGFEWARPEFTRTDTVYTQNLGADKFQRVVEGIDDLINEFIKEGGQKTTVQKMIKAELYSPDLLTDLALGLYGELSKGELKDALSLLGIEISPAEVGKHIELEFYKVKTLLVNSTSWSDLKKEDFDWGFKKGNSVSFQKAVVCLIKPFEKLLNMLLLSGSINIFGLEIYGSNGYNNAVIPLYEALGCHSDLVMSAEQLTVTSRGGKLTENLLRPAFNLIDGILERPVFNICHILPNIVYFVSSGGLKKCIENLIIPIEHTLAQFGITFEGLGINLQDIYEIDIFEVLLSGVNDMVGDDIKIVPPDIKALGTLGQLTEYQSKSVYGTEPITLYKVQAEPTAVILSILRYFVDILRMEENSHLMENLVPTGNTEGGANDMFAQFSTGLGDQFAAMTTDETIEWLYKLFFRERAVTGNVTEVEYIPTVIYKANPKVDMEIASPFIIVFVMGAIILIINRDKIKDFISERKKARDEFSKEV